MRNSQLYARAFFVLAIFSLTIPAASQDGPPSFERLALEEGLSQSIVESEGPRLPLGALSDTVYQRTIVPVEPGNIIVLFSDGIPEAQNPGGEFYGYTAPADLLREMPTGSMSADESKMAIVQDVMNFAGGPGKATT